MAQDTSWLPKLKNYPHFDAPITAEEAVELVTNPEAVASHKFMPFLSYRSLIRKFGTKKPKERLIRYGARKDAYIFSYYRHKLMELYNPALKKLGLDDCIIAYRKIPKEGSENGKCNIDFAKEAFEEILRRQNCTAITLDISGFFENLEHSFIKTIWQRLLGCERLPADHFRVYHNITNYKIVDLDECYERLGWMQYAYANGVRVRQYKESKKNQPKKLCSMQDFRKKIAGSDGEYDTLIMGNPYMAEGNNRGIPQGSPISDVIANMYMLDFDTEIKKFADGMNGYYRRYSDDILLIIPAGTQTLEAIAKVKHELSKYGQNLKIKDSKTIITEFSQADNTLKYMTTGADGVAKGTAFEYLGFSFDGKRTLIKSQTLTRYSKKMIRGVKAAVSEAQKKAQESGSSDLKSHIDMQDLMHRYSTPNRNWKSRDGRKARNFISYAKRSKNTTGDTSIQNQLRNHRKNLKKAVAKELAKREATTF